MGTRRHGELTSPSSRLAPQGSRQPRSSWHVPTFPRSPPHPSSASLAALTLGQSPAPARSGLCPWGGCRLQEGMTHPTLSEVQQLPGPGSPSPADREGAPQGGAALLPIPHCTQAGEAGPEASGTCLPPTPACRCLTDGPGAVAAGGLPARLTPWSVAAGPAPPAPAGQLPRSPCGEDGGHLCALPARQGDRQPLRPPGHPYSFFLLPKTAPHSGTFSPASGYRDCPIHSQPCPPWAWARKAPQPLRSPCWAPKGSPRPRPPGDGPQGGVAKSTGQRLSSKSCLGCPTSWLSALGPDAAASPLEPRQPGVGARTETRAPAILK
nr:nascent polypeptide-associated complex subunit alpha, muscle-specific form [Oryctolagus cuniculus]XP_051692682.1 nascent polypeptide-associated complex subunit alpha, muscle-specific form [Oryctolagus cuniculus]